MKLERDLLKSLPRISRRSRGERPFSVAAPNKAWVTDITYIATDEGWLYLAGIKDLFNGELVGYAIDSRRTQNLVMQALFRAVAARRPDKGLIHHSDRGPPVLRTCLPEAVAAVRHASLHESQGGLLGQRADGKLLGLSENRVDPPSALRHPRRGPARTHRIHRNLLQPDSQAGAARSSVACRLPPSIRSTMQNRQPLNPLDSTESDRPQSAGRYF